MKSDDGKKFRSVVVISGHENSREIDISVKYSPELNIEEGEKNHSVHYLGTILMTVAGRICANQDFHDKLRALLEDEING
ncbi:hypothetical protein [Desulfovibrio legallii]|jgi:hypothetical protein|uniref:Uncharacterized protein n=1 Tax=Desulfovibrio legallii TaxID=571438 RepID=A0A1G7KAQ2_9BACT|nr:hypothetical protein [Desulfovibrio legallii]SDF34255.1 hypothetical protein SAMN05192586_10432 [Desulfovibrio legallii]